MGTVNLQRLSGRYRQNETICGTFLCPVRSVRGPHCPPCRCRRCWCARCLCWCSWCLRCWCCDPQHWPCPRRTRPRRPRTCCAQPAAPAPYTTVAQGPGVTTVHQPEPIITKQVHYGQTSYVSGYNTRILKPATPHLPIQVPTVLKGTQTVNAPIIKTQTEIHNVQEPVLVNKPYDAPYDAPFTTHKVVEVPTPVHVDAPYNVHVPVPVQGETIIKKTVAAPVVTHSHHVQAAPAVAAVAAPAVAAAGYAVAAPAAVAHY